MSWGPPLFQIFPPGSPGGAPTVGPGGIALPGGPAAAGPGGDPSGAADLTSWWSSSLTSVVDDAVLALVGVGLVLIGAFLLADGPAAAGAAAKTAVRGALL